MPLLPIVISFCQSLFRARQLDHDLDDELQSYVRARMARFEAQGMSRVAARRAALVEMGGVEQVKEQVRDRRVGWSTETVWRDLRYGCRMIARSPGFAAVVVMTLALVIGANATVFSVMHAVLWRELPYPEAERLVLLSADIGGVASVGLASEEASDLRLEPGLFDHVAVISSVDAHVNADGDMERVPAASANDDALHALGAAPMVLGRPNVGARDGGIDSVVRSVVISHQLWERLFHADPHIIGRHIDVNNLDVEVVGVLRPDFRVFLPVGARVPEIVDVWFPRGFDNDRRYRETGTIARLAPGTTLAEAQARLDVLAGRFIADHPAAYPNQSLRLRIIPLHELLTVDARPALWVLAGAVGFVLLIGCVNVGNLMLARARARAPEIAMRRALGAGPSRIVRQLFTETAVLTLVGCAAGFALAYAGVALVDWLRPTHLPRQSQIVVNSAVAWYTAALSVMVSFAFGLLPALGHTKEGTQPIRVGRAGMQRSGMRRLQRGLVIGEVALSIVPLVAAGLMLRTFANLTNAPIGFDPGDLLTGKVAVSFRAFPDIAQRWRLHRDALELIRQLPGVIAASAGGPLPFDDWQQTRMFGRAADGGDLQSRATLQTVLPGYLDITGTRLLAGRDFTDDDVVHERQVVIVDERIAGQLWPNGAIGQRLAVSRGRSSASLEVIGVTRSVRVTRVRDEAMPHMFVPYHFYGIELALVIESTESAAALGPAIKQAVESLGTRRPVYDIRPMRSYVDESMGDTRFMMLVLIGFGITSLLLAAIGLYGTLAYLTSQRMQEFGVRMALGASAGRVLRSVAGEGLWLTAIGAALGLAGAMAATGALQGLLYDVKPFDGVTLLATIGVVALTALIAASHPAWRAAKTDPCTALRAE